MIPKWSGPEEYEELRGILPKHVTDFGGFIRDAIESAKRLRTHKLQENNNHACCDQAAKRDTQRRVSDRRFT
jgi:hypothetical protein